MYLHNSVEMEHKQHSTAEKASQHCPGADTLVQRPAKLGNEEGHRSESHGSRSGSFSSVTEDTQGAPQSFFVRSRSQAQGPRGDASPEQIKNFSACSAGSPVCYSDNQEELLLDGPVQCDAIALKPLIFDDTSETSENVKFFKGEPAPLEQLPVEVLENIIDHLTVDLPPQGLMRRNMDILASLLVSKRLCSVTLNIIYRKVTLPHSYVFSKFLSHISDFPELGSLVKRLDLSHFNSIGLGRTREMNLEIQNLTSDTLLRCLSLTPNLQELLLQEHLDQDLDQAVLTKVLTGLPRLRALDLCASYAGSFSEAFSSAVTSDIYQTQYSNIQKLGLHECFTISSSDLEALLRRMPHLKILDLYHTRVTIAALQSIPHTARLTHLNLGLCTNITGPQVTTFLTAHPAAARLVHLNLACDLARSRLLRNTDLDVLLPRLPKSLRSLNLAGAQLRAETHMPHLLRLSKHLEELGLGHTELSMTDIKSFFQPPRTTDNDSPKDSPATAPPAEQWPSQPCTLHYLDLTGIPSVTQPSLFFDPPSPQRSSRIDIPLYPTSAPITPPLPFLLSPASYPLEVLELSASVATDLKRIERSNRRYGWLVKELGRRAWYVSETGARNDEGDPAGGRKKGERWWKMGCRSWGMRKVNVVEGEVGGLYGWHMFRK